MKSLLIAAAMLVLPALAFAQTDSTRTAAHPNSLRAGVWALQFDVNGQLLNVESFTGGLSLKRQFSPKWALRFGVGFNARGNTLTNDTSAPDFDYDEDAYGVGMEVVYQRYLNPRDAVNAYWALGPLLDYDHMKSEASRDSSSVEQTLTRWTAGAVGAFGAEWFFTSRFSLHAEYTARFSYYRRDQEDLYKRTGESDEYRKREDEGWSFGTSDVVRLGLSVYF